MDTDLYSVIETGSLSRVLSLAANPPETCEGREVKSGTEAPTVRPQARSEDVAA